MTVSLKPAPKRTSDGLFKCILELQEKAMKPGIPMAQREALNHRSMELRTQLMELRAARFNKATQKYEKAISRVDATIGDLRGTMKEIDDAIAIVNKAAKVFDSMHRLLTVAREFMPF